MLEMKSYRWPWFVSVTTCFVSTFLLVGCGETTPAPDPQQGQAESAAPSPSPSPSSAIDPKMLVQSQAEPLSNDLPPLPKSDDPSDELAEAMFGDAASNASATTVSPNTANSAPNVPDRRVNLRTDLPPERLVEFLKLADLEMQNIASGKAGIFDQRQANEEMVRIGKLKLQAATQLETSTTADEDQKALAIRGQLQSLSHLAALGDLKSAEQLETLANAQVTNSDLTVAEDSRLVLIGLALERIQNGSSKEADDVMRQVAELGKDGRAPNIAAMMVLGQARAVLEKYGFTEQATVVRKRIVDLFASHSDPAVASMAHDIAGTPRFAEVDKAMRELSQGKDVSVSDWRTTIKGLLAESPDLAGVQFAAGAALQLEAADETELADATYAELESAKLGEQEQKEIELAMAARKARQSIIGQEVEFNLPSTDGRPLSMSSYTGRVVLMPFWAVNFPDSLTVLQQLDEIRANAAGKVEIVGMNLDSSDAPVEKFLAKSPVRFRSFFSESKPSQPGNEMATKFGMVSMPFVAVIGPDGKVAAIDFTGQRLEKTVSDLLAK
jgi:thiol-disulfide isomerase/thioredoxin